jgi:hypothetical protein
MTFQKLRDSIGKELEHKEGTDEQGGKIAECPFE